MFSEVTNALFLTFLATEYGAAFQRSVAKSSRIYDVGSDIKKQHRSKIQRLGVVFVLVVLVNVIEDVTGIGFIVHALTEVFLVLHLPKAVFVAFAYVIALYVDCRLAVARSNKNKSLMFQRDFFPRVIRLFLRILPVYPVAAVLISFGFMFVIAFFEFLHWSVNSLNWPIYYGTLYGPFSYIYYITKRDVLQEASSFLPQTSGTFLGGERARNHV